MNKIITKTYQPKKSNLPIWRESNRVIYRHYEFDLSDATKHNAKGRGFPCLVWKHEHKPSDTTMVGAAEHEFYHGCSYYWHHYNPMPVTGWFRGVPLKQMFKWCEKHGLTNPRLVIEYVEITYEDTSDDKSVF